MNLNGTEAIVLDTEGGVYDVRYIVLQHPVQRGEQVRIHCLYVCETNALIQQHLQRGTV